MQPHASPSGTSAALPLDVAPQARIVAQAGLLTGAMALSLATLLSEDTHAHSATTQWKLRSFEPAPTPAAAGGGVDGTEAASAASGAGSELRRVAGGASAPVAGLADLPVVAAATATAKLQ